MTTRNITGTIFHSDGTPWASASLVFSSDNDLIGSDGIYSRDVKTATTAADGTFTVALAVPDTGTRAYHVTTPTEQYDFNLGAGASISLGTLISTGEAAVTVNALQALFDTHVGATNPHTQYNAISPSLLVAAYNAPLRVRQRADYVCGSTDAELQIANARAALPAAGGAVQLSEGLFTIHSAGYLNQDTLDGYYGVLVDQTGPPLSMIGVPNATAFKSADGQPVNMAMILVRGSVASHRTKPVYIYGIEFDGNAANQTGVWRDFGNIAIGDADNVIIENCYFHDWVRNGVHAAWTAQKVKVINNRFYGQGATRLENHHYIVQGNIFEDPNTTSVIPGGANVQIVCDADRGTTSMMCKVVDNDFIGGIWPLMLNGSQNCLVMGNTFVGQVHDEANDGFAIYLNQYGGLYDVSGNIIIGNVIYDCYGGITLRGSGTKGAIGNIVAYNEITKGPSTAMGWGIQEGWGTSANNQFKDNTLTGPFFVAAMEISGATPIIRGNVGYKTEARGAAANVADGGTITHGLATTPTWVNVTPSVAGEMVSVTAVGATTFTVAIKKHDNSAGTTQTVYWEAEV